MLAQRLLIQCSIYTKRAKQTWLGRTMDEHEVILLAEDDPNDSFFIQSACASAGIRHRVQVVANGREAIHYLSGGGMFSDRDAYPFPSLLLLDLDMPISNGFEVLRWIQENQQTAASLVVVVLTGMESKVSEDEARRLGAHDFLKKPISLHELDSMMLHLKQKWIDFAHADEVRQ